VHQSGNKSRATHQTIQLDNSHKQSQKITRSSPYWVTDYNRIINVYA